MRVQDPLVVTLQCDGAGWKRCEELRERHFPAARNVVPAHLMLFHHLPGEELAQVALQAAEAASLVSSFPVRVSRLRSLGRGVAFMIESPELLSLHRALSASWEPWLIAQDRARFSPHITIQNKVTSEETRRLLAMLEKNFEPFSIEAVGVEIWHYRGGPWEPAAFARFSVRPTP